LLAEVKEREGRVIQREDELNLRERQLRQREEELGRRADDLERDLKKLERARANAGFAALVLNSICRDKRCVDIGVGIRKNDIITLLNHDFIIDKCLGKGVSGTVYSAMFIPKREKRIVNGAFPVISDGESEMGFQRYQSVAIKISKDASKLDNEAKIHESLGDIRGVPKIFGSDSRAIIMENCGNNLHDIFLKENRRLPEHEDVLGFGLQILEIVEEMHTRGYLHRDIKPANLTMKEDKKLHLIDFGESRNLNGKSHIESGHSTSVYGSLNYNTVRADGSPLEITKEDDLWSVYFVLLELKTGNLDWRRARDDAQKTKKHEHMYSCKQWFIQNRDCKIIKLLNKPDINYEEKLISFKHLLKEREIGLF
jgi:tau tubulin kinase